MALKTKYSGLTDVTSRIHRDNSGQASNTK